MKTKAFASKNRDGRGAIQPSVEVFGTDSPASRLQIRQILRGSALQAKLVVGALDDVYEQEADRVAEQVMRMPEPAVQRESETDEEEELLQPKAWSDQGPPEVQRQEQPQEYEEEELLQAKAAEGIQEISPSMAQELTRLKGSGQPLDPRTRAYFEPRFGVDFGDVRIHTDSRAASVAQAVRAQAFTLGRHIVFGEGRYVPDSDPGKRLLAHELTHVLQQSPSDFRPSPLESYPLSTSTYRVDSIGFRQTLRTPEQQLQRSPGRPSGLIPDLDDATVSELERTIPMARADFLRQQMLDAIVSDRRRKGVDFSIMEGNRPRYDSGLWQQAMQQLPADQRSLPRNGITLHPQTALNPSSLPLVLIGPTAFGPLTDPSNRELVREIVVRLYTAVTHEYRHATQWQNPPQARAMGLVGREVDAFFLDIENSRATGLAGQQRAFRNTWDEALAWWRQLRQPASWNALSDEQRQGYIARCRRVFTIVQSILGSGVSSPCGP